MFAVPDRPNVCLITMWSLAAYIGGLPMPEVGVRELKARASEIVREVRERRARYVITHRGRPVGVLIPVNEAGTEPSETAAVWDRLVRLGNEIAEDWPAGLDSGKVLSDMRR